MTRPFCFLLLALLGALAGACAEPRLRLGGSFAGEVQPWPELPEVAWQVEFSGTTAATGEAHLSADTPAGPVRADLALEADGQVAWSVPSQAVELAAVQAWLGPVWPELKDFQVGGAVQVSGEGTWAVDAGAVGRLQVAWSAEAVAWPDYEVSLQGLTLAAEVVVSDSAIKQIVVDLAWSGARVASTALGAGELRAIQRASGEWWLEHATLQAWQGEVKIVPFAFDPAAPRLKTTVAVVNVALHELAPFFPEAVTAANGRLSGGFAVDWDLQQGLRFGRGFLQVLNTEVAQVKLAASPGLLSGGVPAKFAILPSWLGPLAEWTAADNPAHRELEDIELGRRFIQVDSLQIDLEPDGTGQPRSARLHLVGKPADSPLVERVEFTVNVTGPLQEFVELMADKRARISAGKN